MNKTILYSLKTITLSLIISACGKDPVSNNSNSSSNLVAAADSVLSIPNPNVIGGYPTIMYQGASLQIYATTTAVNSYITSLKNNQVNVAPLSSDTHSRQYRVKYIGTVSTGRCPFNPNAQCPLMNLQSISAY